MFRAVLLATAFAALISAAYAQPVDQRNPVFSGPGVVVGAPAGGNLGPGTINTQGVYVNGQAVGGGVAIPSASLLGGTGTAFSGVALGSNLSVSNGTLNATTPTATVSTPGAVQPDGSTVAINSGVISAPNAGKVGTVTDGTHTVSGVGNLTFSGAAVSGSGGNATVAISGGAGGTVTSAAVATANGFSGTVANPTTTPTITITVPVTGLLKGNGTGVSAATAGTDFLAPGGPVAATTVNATANSGYSLNGVPVIGNNLSNSVGPSVGPAIQFTVPSIDLAQFSNFIRQNQFNTTLAPSAATNTIFENFTDFLTLNGPGAANGEINLMVLVSTINSGATWGTGENYESSMINNGTIGGYTSYTALAHNGSTGTATRITGLQLQPENDNATAGSWATYVGIECNPVSGPGGTGSPASQPTNSYCFQNSDANQVIATAGRLSVGSLGGPASDIWLQVTGPDTSASTYNFLTRDSGSNTLFYVTDAGTAWLKAGLTLAGITGSTQCLQASSTGLVSGTGAACGSGSGGVSLSVANAWTAQQTFAPASGTSVTVQGPDATGGTFPFIVRNSAGNIFFIDDTGAAAIPNALTIGAAGSKLGNLIFQNLTSGSILVSAPTGALGNVAVTLPDASTALAGLAVAQTFTAAQTFSSAVNIGSPSVTPGSLNINGPVTSTQGSVVSAQLAYSYPANSQDFRPKFFQDTVTVPSGTTSGILESNWFGAEFTGTGTISGEINTIHCFQHFDAGLTLTDFNECEEVSGQNDTVGFNSHASYTSLFSNSASATITGTISALSISYTNNNATAGSWANFNGITCNGNNGTGANATNATCLQNFDPAEMISSAGPARFGNIVNGSGSLNSTGTTTSHFGANQMWFNSANVGNAMVSNDGGVGVAFANLGTFSATLVVGDEAGAATYGTHIGVQQTTAPGVTNATLDATASDVTGTLTLTAANPVVTFRVAYHSAPHCTVSSSTGSILIATPPTTTALTLSGGVSGNTATYQCIQ